MATLEMTEGPEPGRRFALVGDLVSFGREDTCTFQILDEGVSRTHLQVLLKVGRHFAGDYRSTNGVFVNDRQIVEHTPLSDGDRIRIGGVTLVYRADDPGDTQARPPAPQAKAKGQWATETLEREH